MTPIPANPTVIILINSLGDIVKVKSNISNLKVIGTGYPTFNEQSKGMPYEITEIEEFDRRLNYACK